MTSCLEYQQNQDATAIGDEDEEHAGVNKVNHCIEYDSEASHPNIQRPWNGVPNWMTIFVSFVDCCFE